MSDSDQGDLDLEALKSIFGSNVFDDTPPTKEKKKKTSSKNTNKTASKKTTKKKKSPINLDALLDGVDIDPTPNDNNDPIEFDFTNTQTEKKQKKPIIENFDNDIFGFQTADIFENLEKKIEKYLDSSFQTLRSDVIHEIEQIICESDNIDDMIIDFIEKLKHSIYETIEYEKTAAFGIQNTFYNIFEDFSTEFLSSFRKISLFASQSRNQSINTIRSCRNLVKTKYPNFERQMKNAINDINNEINELNNERKKDASYENENKKRMRSYFHQSVLLEGKLKALDEMNDYTLKKLEQIQDSKNKIFSSTKQKIPDDDIFIKHVRNASHYLKNNFLQNKMNDSDFIKTRSNKFYNACEDLLTSTTQVEVALDMISSSFSMFSTIPQIGVKKFESSEQDQTTTNKSKIVEETLNNLKINRAQREAQFQQVNEMLNRMKK